MQIQCPRCRHVTEYSGDAPRFCSHCGGPLSAAPQGPGSDAETLAHVPTSSDAETRVETVGQYKLHRELGRGGMGVVYEAEEQGTGRRVALKLLSPKLRRTDETVERFLREGRLAASLSHPRSTFVYAAGEHEGQFYIAMELMPGGTVDDVVADEGPLPVARAVDYILDVIDGLEAAHAAGVMHRDVKPSNCFLDGDGRVKVGDFGLSKSLVSDAALTQTGAFMGTPQFAAPEQVRGEAVDERTDVYAVGATLFYLLTGRAPFIGDAAQVIAGIASVPAPRLRNHCPAAPLELERIVAQALEKDPENRYRELSQMRQALLPFASGGTSMADVGRRLAAYFLDTMVVGMGLGMLVGMSAVAVMTFVSGVMSRETQLILQIVGMVGLIGYFGVAEGRWGRGVGKLLMGLRVVNAQGEPPGVQQGVLRALFIPGCGAMATLVLQYYLSANPAEGFNLAMVLVQWSGWALCLLLLATMRRDNGYRGIHEFASDTRVVRIRGAGAHERAHEVPVVVPVAPDGPRETLGPFELSGVLGRSGPSTVWLGRDVALGRRVWIHRRPAGRQLPAARLGVMRPARPFWLQGGEQNGERWDAFEAVAGAPLTSLSGGGSQPWERGRGVLLDLAAELSAALADGTLPERLTLEQVWVDRNGHVKLLDVPIAGDDDPFAAAAGEAPPGEDDAARALALWRAAADVCCRGRLLPGHAQRLLAELAERPATAETLDWLLAQLRESAQRHATLRWDDRLGIMAATAGTENTVYSTFVLAITWLVGKELAAPPLATGLAALAVALAVAAVLSGGFRGGPVFWFTGIEVRTRAGGAAGRLRSGWRGMWAWAPLGISYVMLGLMTVFQEQMMMRGRVTGELLMALCSCGFLLSFALGALGCIYAVVRPRRGLQDILAGTCLVPR